MQLTEQVQQLQAQIADGGVELKAEKIDLESKLRILNTQHEKLVAKNQSDHVEWKTKEKTFTVYMLTSYIGSRSHPPADGGISLRTIGRS